MKHDDHVRILFLSANPPGTRPLRLNDELDAVQKVLQSAPDPYRASFAPIDVKPAATWADLSAGLYAQPHIVHYCGHGQQGGALSFEDEDGIMDLVRLTDLRNLIGALGGAGVRCVVLNACWSAGQMDQVARLTEVVEFVIGMAAPVSDRAAIAFAKEFYRGISHGDAQGRPIDLRMAFEAGKAALVHCVETGGGSSERQVRAEAIPRLFERPGFDASGFVVTDLAAIQQAPTGIAGLTRRKWFTPLKWGLPSARHPFGRDAAMAQAQASFDAVRASGRGRALVISAPRGFGKFALARHLALRWQAEGATVLATGFSPALEVAGAAWDAMRETWPDGARAMGAQWVDLMLQMQSALGERWSAVTHGRDEPEALVRA